MTLYGTCIYLYSHNIYYIQISAYSTVTFRAVTKTKFSGVGKSTLGVGYSEEPTVKTSFLYLYIFYTEADEYDFIIKAACMVTLVSTDQYTLSYIFTIIKMYLQRSSSDYCPRLYKWRLKHANERFWPKIVCCSSGNCL